MPPDTGLPFAPAAERNKQAILDALRPRLPDAARVLEIGAGTGQHAVHCAAGMPGIQWQPSDRRINLPGLQAQINAAGLSNIKPPIELDVNQGDWPNGPFDAVFAANVAHIMSFPEVERMLQQAARCLGPQGLVFLYGPFHRDGQPTSPGNADFDAKLRLPENPDGPNQGIRDDQDMIRAASRAGLNLHEDIEMPANNRILVFIKPCQPE